MLRFFAWMLIGAASPAYAQVGEVASALEEEGRDGSEEGVRVLGAIKIEINGVAPVEARERAMHEAMRQAIEGILGKQKAGRAAEQSVAEERIAHVEIETEKFSADRYEAIFSVGVRLQPLAGTVLDPVVLPAIVDAMGRSWYDPEWADALAASGIKLPDRSWLQEILDGGTLGAGLFDRVAARYPGMPVHVAARLGHGTGQSRERVRDNGVRF